MYNYIMLIMGAIDEDRQKEAQKQMGTLSKEQIRKMQNQSALSRLLGEDSYSKLDDSKKMITIEVTPEDMKNAKEEREKRQKEIKERKLSFPSRRKVSPSGK